MALKASLWNGDSWATRGGKDKADSAHGVFQELQARCLCLEGQSEILQGRELDQLVEPAEVQWPDMGSEEAAQMGEKVSSHL